MQSFQYLKGAYKQEGNQLSIQVDRNRTWGNDFKLKERRFRWDVRGKFSLFTESAEVLEQAAQGGCGCPIPGGVQGQVGWGLEQPDLVFHLAVGNPACSLGVET